MVPQVDYYFDRFGVSIVQVWLFTVHQQIIYSYYNGGGLCRWYSHYWLWPAEIVFVKAKLNILLGIKDLGYLNYFLGLEVAHLSNEIFLSPKKFIAELLQLSDLSDLSPTATSLPLNCKLLPEEGALLLDPIIYRTLIGKLNFLTNENAWFELHS